MAMSCWSQAAMESPSFSEPPGWQTAVDPGEVRRRRGRRNWAGPQQAHVPLDFQDRQGGGRVAGGDRALDEALVGDNAGSGRLVHVAVEAEDAAERAVRVAIPRPL